MLRKLRLRQKTGFLIKKRVVGWKKRVIDTLSKFFVNNRRIIIGCGCLIITQILCKEKD